MPYRCLTDFLEDLGHAGELTRVEQALSPVEEVGEFVANASQAGGHALLFSEIIGHEVPCLCNLFGAEKRVCRALDTGSLDDVSGRLDRLLHSAAAGGWFERLKSGNQSVSLDSVGPRQVKSAAVQQIVRLGNDIDLGELPLLQVASMPQSVRVIANATVLSAEPDTHLPVFGRCDLQPIDAARLAVCWANCDEHARLLREYRMRGQKMPVAIVIGGDPGFLLASAAPVPSNADVCAVAGLLREKAIDVVACRSIDLNVPAEAEIVIEGFVDPETPPVAAGPLCGPLGLGAGMWTSPVLQVTAVTHRANPIYVALVPGRPPNEASVLARALHRVFLPLARSAMPELVDYDLPAAGGVRHWAAVSIRKAYAGQGRRAAHAAWLLPAIRFAKMLIVVDDAVDVHNHAEVLAAIAANADLGVDTIVERGPADPYDPVATRQALGHKMAIDATRKLPGERDGG